MGVSNEERKMEFLQIINGNDGRVLDIPSGPVGAGCAFRRRASVRRRPVGGADALQGWSGVGRLPIGRHQVVSHVFDEDSFSLLQCK